MHDVVLQRADNLQPCAVTNMRQPWAAVSSEVALADAAVRRSVEDRALAFEFTYSLRRLFGV